jgi:hypothetical protein
MRFDCVLADRGLGTVRGDAALRAHDVGDAVIPRRGRASPAEASACGSAATASATDSRGASPRASPGQERRTTTPAPRFSLPRICRHDLGICRLATKSSPPGRTLWSPGQRDSPAVEATRTAPIHK